MGRFAAGDILPRSKAFALRVIGLVRTLPREPAAEHLGKQLLRSATSVGANLHEADMAETRRDFCNKVNIAQKEAAEAAYWISLFRESALLRGAKGNEVEAEAVEIRKVCRQIVLATRRAKPG